VRGEGEKGKKEGGGLLRMHVFVKTTQRFLAITIRLPTTAAWSLLVIVVRDCTEIRKFESGKREKREEGRRKR